MRSGGGKLNVRPFPGGTLGPDLQIVSGMQGLGLVEQARHTDHWITRQLLDPGLMGVAVALVDRRDSAWRHSA